MSCPFFVRTLASDEKRGELFVEAGGEAIAGGRVEERKNFYHQVTKKKIIFLLFFVPWW